MTTQDRAGTVRDAMWLVKVRRYDGSVSVIRSHCRQSDAEAWVQKLNEDEQPQKYYAEQFDPARGFRG